MRQGNRSAHDRASRRTSAVHTSYPSPPPFLFVSSLFTCCRPPCHLPFLFLCLAAFLFASLCPPLFPSVSLYLRLSAFTSCPSVFLSPRLDSNRNGLAIRRHAFVKSIITTVNFRRSGRLVMTMQCESWHGSTLRSKANNAAYMRVHHVCNVRAVNVIALASCGACWHGSNC